MSIKFTFVHICAGIRSSRNLPPLPPGLTILGIDPGHTTGWCKFRDQALLGRGQLNTREFDNYTVEKLRELIADTDVVVIEDYRVYRWKARQHIGSELLTSQVIGGIEMLCSYLNSGRNINIYKQPAHLAKGFVTDTKLHEWGFYVRGNKHSNDAVRHACYWQLFNKAGG